MREATIILLHKKGDHDDLANWRPISPLNIDYKILSKLINNRIKPRLPKLVHRDQKGFITERKLEDAVLKTTHLINYCIRENIPAYLLCIDQEKAFDRVDHDYLYMIIEKFNFGLKVLMKINNWTLIAAYAPSCAGNELITSFLSEATQLSSGQSPVMICGD